MTDAGRMRDALSGIEQAIERICTTGNQTNRVNLMSMIEAVHQHIDDVHDVLQPKKKRLRRVED